MSELKDYDIMDIEAMDDERLEKSESGKIQVTRVYIKSEADKVIADLEEGNKMEVEQLLMEIAKLKKERRWRKFPDEKPEWGKEVLVVDGESKHYIVRFSYDMKWISWGIMNTCESKNVKYWMPLPSAPKEAK